MIPGQLLVTSMLFSLWRKGTITDARDGQDFQKCGEAVELTDIQSEGLFFLLGVIIEGMVIWQRS